MIKELKHDNGEVVYYNTKNGRYIEKRKLESGLLRWKLDGSKFVPDGQNVDLIYNNTQEFLDSGADWCFSFCFCSKVEPGYWKGSRYIDVSLEFVNGSVTVRAFLNGEIYKGHDVGSMIPGYAYNVILWKAPGLKYDDFRIMDAVLIDKKD